MRDGKRPFDRVIVFDLDDTLYLERRYVESGLRAVGAWAKARLGLDDLGPIMLARFTGGQRTRIFDDSLEALGMKLCPALISRMLAVYRQHRPDISLEADSEAFLCKPPPDTGLAVLTDGFLDAQRRKIRALDLYRRGIHVGICTDCWGREAWKPSPRAYLHLQQRFGLPSDHFTYVADNPAKDFHAPNSLGWRTVRIARPERLHKALPERFVDADRIIDTMNDL